MKRFATIFIGSALGSLVASYGFAAEPAPEAKSVAAPQAAAAAVPAVAAEPAESSLKVGYVDMARVAAESGEGKAATAAIKSRSEKLKAKIDARQKQLEKQKNAIQAQLPTMTPKERSEKAKEFQKKVEEYQKLVRASELEMAKLQDKLTNEVGGVIKKASAEYAKAHGYLLIIEEKGVLFLDDKIKPKDVTEEVVASLKKTK